MEVAPDDVVRILFHKDDERRVKEAIYNLYDVAVEVFGDELTKQMIDINELRRAHVSGDNAKEHSKKLRELSGNPQGPDEHSTYTQPKQAKARCYYGTYLEVAKGNQTQASEITQDSTEDSDLRKQIQEIAQAQKTLESSLPTTIGTVVSQQLAPITKRVSTIESTHKNQVEEFMKIINNKFTSIQDSFAQLGVPAQAPSEANASPLGVGK